MVSWRLTVLLMGSPVSCEENFCSSSTSAKSCLACSGVMCVADLAALIACGVAELAGPGGGFGGAVAARIAGPLRPSLQPARA